MENKDKKKLAANSLNLNMNVNKINSNISNNYKTIVKNNLVSVNKQIINANIGNNFNIDINKKRDRDKNKSDSYFIYDEEIEKIKNKEKNGTVQVNHDYYPCEKDQNTNISRNIINSKFKSKNQNILEHNNTTGNFNRENKGKSIDFKRFSNNITASRSKGKFTIVNESIPDYVNIEKNLNLNLKIDKIKNSESSKIDYETTKDNIKNSIIINSNSIYNNHIVAMKKKINSIEIKEFTEKPVIVVNKKNVNYTTFNNTRMNSPKKLNETFDNKSEIVLTKNKKNDEELKYNKCSSSVTLGFKSEKIGNVVNIKYQYKLDNYKPTNEKIFTSNQSKISHSTKNSTKNNDNTDSAKFKNSNIDISNKTKKEINYFINNNRENLKLKNVVKNEKNIIINNTYNTNKDKGKDVIKSKNSVLMNSVKPNENNGKINQILKYNNEQNSIKRKDSSDCYNIKRLIKNCEQTYGTEIGNKQYVNNVNDNVNSKLNSFNLNEKTNENSMHIKNFKTNNDLTSNENKRNQRENASSNTNTSNTSQYDYNLKQFREMKVKNVKNIKCDLLSNDDFNPIKDNKLCKPIISNNNQDNDSTANTYNKDNKAKSQYNPKSRSLIKIKQTSNNNESFDESIKKSISKNKIINESLNNGKSMINLIIQDELKSARRGNTLNEIKETKEIQVEKMSINVKKTIDLNMNIIEGNKNSNLNCTSSNTNKSISSIKIKYVYSPKFTNNIPMKENRYDKKEESNLVVNSIKNENLKLQNKEIFKSKNISAYNSNNTITKSNNEKLLSKNEEYKEKKTDIQDIRDIQIHDDFDILSNIEKIDYLNDIQDDFKSEASEFKLDKNIDYNDISNLSFINESNLFEHSLIKKTNKPIKTARPKINFNKSKNTNVCTPKSIIENLFEIKKIKKEILNYFDLNSLFNLHLSSKFMRDQLKTNLKKSYAEKVMKNCHNPLYRIMLWKNIFRYSNIDKQKSSLLYDHYLREANKDKDQFEIYKKQNNGNNMNEFNYIIQIEKDINRTFPKNSEYKGIELKKLLNILMTYAKYNNNIGYAQGMNFISAISLYVLTEESDCFILLDSIINKFNLDKILSINNNDIVNVLNEYEKLINQYNPNLVKYLEENGLSVNFLTTQWIITLFSSSMDIKILFQLWDILFLFDSEFLKFVIVSILRTFENMIISWTQMELSIKIKTLLKTDLFYQSFHYIIMQSIDLMDNHIYSYL